MQRCMESRSCIVACRMQTIFVKKAWAVRSWKWEISGDG